MEFPASQVTVDTIDIIERIKKELNKKVKEVKAKSTSLSVRKEIVDLLHELEDLEMTVGNMRETKIGKILTRYEKELPEPISSHAKRINGKWKEMLIDYRQRIKDKISQKPVVLSGEKNIKEEPLSQVVPDDSIVDDETAEKSVVYKIMSPVQFDRCNSSMSSSSSSPTTNPPQQQILPNNKSSPTTNGSDMKRLTKEFLHDVRTSLLTSAGKVTEMEAELLNIKQNFLNVNKRLDEYERNMNLCFHTPWGDQERDQVLSPRALTIQQPLIRNPISTIQSMKSEGSNIETKSNCSKEVENERPYYTNRTFNDSDHALNNVLENITLKKSNTSNKNKNNRCNLNRNESEPRESVDNCVTNDLLHENKEVSLTMNTNEEELPKKKRKSNEVFQEDDIFDGADDCNHINIVDEKRDGISGSTEKEMTLSQATSSIVSKVKQKYEQNKRSSILIPMQAKTTHCIKPRVKIEKLKFSKENSNFTETSRQERSESNKLPWQPILCNENVANNTVEHRKDDSHLFKAPSALIMNAPDKDVLDSIIIKGEAAMDEDIQLEGGDNLSDVQLEEFLSFSQAVDNIGDEIDHEQKSFLLENKKKTRTSWNNYCKSMEGVKYAPLVKTNGRMKAAHKTSVGKQAIQNVLNQKSRFTSSQSSNGGCRLSNPYIK